jgi:predicted DNA binding protein
MAGIAELRPPVPSSGRNPSITSSYRPAPKVVNSSGRIVTCRLRISLAPSSWLHRFTTRNPEFRLELFDRVPIAPRRSLAEVRFHGPRDPGWEAEFQQMPGIEQIEVLEQDELSALCQIIHVTPPWLATARRLRVIWRHPIWVMEGVARWEVVGTEDRVRELLSTIAPTVENVRVDAIVRGAGERPTETLTPRQSELLRRAVNEGYFDVPRRISLTELAGRLSVCKSTLSERLAIVERKLIAGAADVLGFRGLSPADAGTTGEPTPCAAAPGPG